MKIRLAILDNDASYLNRIVSVFGSKYSDSFEIYSFTEKEIALSTIVPSKIDVLLASDNFEIDVEKLPKRCGFAYLVEAPEVDSVRDVQAIAKYQKADLIYKQILSLYSDTASSISGIRLDGDTAKIIAFQPASGGCGASTMAAACAVHFAQIGKRTLYLCLEKFGSAGLFFSSEGQFSMSDLIFALKSKKPNLIMKLESYVEQDDSGVFFYAPSTVALDMMELSPEDIVRLISEINLSGSYDVIVVDMDFSIGNDALTILRKAHSVVWVGDGSQNSNLKLMRAYSALCLKEENSDSPLPARLVVMYNKYSSKTGEVIDFNGLRVIGGSPRYEHATNAMLLSQLSRMEIFNELG